MKNKFTKYIDILQQQISNQIENIDGKSKFKIDNWNRKNGGGGLTMAIENGNVFEKGGVNVSKVFGTLPDSMTKLLDTNKSDFFACGISLVLHPKNPMVPTFHANLRYFELYENNQLKDSWFGGGLDLTPYYIFEDDIIFFHNNCKIICDKFNSNFYHDFKEKCDSYFWNDHRNEARGVGGLFFDYCRAKDEVKIDNWFSFVSELGNNLMNVYCPIVKKRKDMSYNNDNINWQQIRRGRYVEFNLIHDKGTLFGLKTKGRIESILISMPPKAQWSYDLSPKKGSEEEKLLEILKKPVNWI
tara:strand:+ start:1435 stop:2334 length:900 start_codon:yes stop_codon:yes gene_type:complete